MVNVCLPRSEMSNFELGLILIQACVYSHELAQHHFLSAVSLACCEHVKASNVPGLRISQEEHSQKWRKFLDPATGKRRLTCKSRQAIPEDVDLSERASEYKGT
jgi:hypothetical protein